MLLIKVILKSYRRIIRALSGRQLAKMSGTANATLGLQTAVRGYQLSLLSAGWLFSTLTSKSSLRRDAAARS